MTTLNPINDADQQTLINRPNDLLAKHHARVYIENVPESILAFYEDNAEKITGEVLVVRSKKNEGFAAFRRDNASKALFLFGSDYWVGSYFSGSCQKIVLPKDLLARCSD